MTRRDKLQQMLQDSPHDTFLLYGLAMEERSAGDETAALDGFDRVLAVDPQYISAYFQKGQTLTCLERIDDARVALREGVEVAQQLGDDHAVGEMTEFLQSLPNE